MRDRIVDYFYSIGIPFYLPGYQEMRFLTLLMVLILAFYLATSRGYTRWLYFLKVSLVVASILLGVHTYRIIVNLPRCPDLDFISAFFTGMQTCRYSTPTGGFMGIGAMIGGLLGALIVSKFNRKEVFKLTDFFAVALGLGLFLGRLGCFLAGCCYGKVSRVPWSMAFPRGSPVCLHQQAEGLISVYNPLSLPVHPTQLYESLFGLVLFVVLWKLYRKRAYENRLIFLFLIPYSGFRFIIDFFREDNPIFIWLVSLPQFLFAILFVLTLAAFYHFDKIFRTKLDL